MSFLPCTSFLHTISRCLFIYTSFFISPFVFLLFLILYICFFYSFLFHFSLLFYLVFFCQTNPSIFFFFLQSLNIIHYFTFLSFSSFFYPTWSPVDIIFFLLCHHFNTLFLLNHIIFLFSSLLVSLLLHLHNQFHSLVLFHLSLYTFF